MTIEDLFTKNEEERYLYEQWEKGRHDYINAMNTAERRGEAKGRKEMAAKMLERGLSPEAVAEFSGLTMDEVKSLTSNSHIPVQIHKWQSAWASVSGEITFSRRIPAARLRYRGDSLNA